jgi:hypothetical protein
VPTEYAADRRRPWALETQTEDGMRGMFQAMVFGSLALGLGLGADDAWAKDKKEKGRPAQGIEPTGIQSFDRVFDRVDEIDSLLSHADAQLRTGKRNLNSALELKKGTPVADGIAELQRRAEGKLGIAMDGAVPKLTATDAVPTNVQSAVDAVNGLTSNLTASLADLQGLAPQIEGLVKDTQKLPNRLKDEFTKTNGAGLLDLLFKLPKTTKALTHDLEVTAGLTGRTTSLTGRITDILGVVQSEFPIVDGGRQRPAQPQPSKGRKGKGGGYPSGGREKG